MKWLIGAFLLCAITGATAQSVQGTVVDENETALPYAHVINLSQLSGTVSQENGYFLINADVGDTIRVTFIGYKPLFFIADEEVMSRDLLSTMARDDKVLQSVWVYADPKYRVPKRHKGIAMKIPGVKEPSTRPTPQVMFSPSINPMTLAPSVGVRGALSYFSKDNVEKRKAELAYANTSRIITFSRLMALEKTRDRLRNTFMITDSELDRLIKIMNIEHPHIQKLNREETILSQVTAYISSKTR